MEYLTAQTFLSRREIPEDACRADANADDQKHFWMISSGAPLRILPDQVIHTCLKCGKHPFYRRFSQNVFTSMLREFGSHLIVVQQAENAVSQCWDIITRDHEAVAPRFQVESLRGMILPLLGNYREPPVKCLVDAQAQVARDCAQVSHLAQFADLEVLRIVDLTQVHCVLAIHTPFQLIAQARSYQDEADVSAVQATEGLDEVVNTFPAVLLAHAPHENHCFFEGNAKLAFNLFLRLLNRRIVFKVHRVVSYKDLGLTFRPEEFATGFAVKNQSITYPVHVSVQKTAYFAVLGIPVTAFGPECERD